jgi:U3 small nucleolar RNA-associated protein 25
MAQFSKTRINRVYKRSGPKQKQRPYNSQSRPAPEPSIPSEDEEPIEPSDVDSESDSETKSRPYNTLLDIFKINPEKQGRSRKRRKLDKAQAYASSDEDEDDIIDEEDDGQYLEVEEEEVEVAEDHESDTEEAKDDPFETHINAPEATEIASRVQALQSNGWTNSKRAFGSLGDCTIYSPKETKIHNQLLGAQKGLISASGMKKKLEVAAERVERDFSETTKALSPYIFGYSDVLFGARTPQNSPSLRQATCLHVLNHVFKTRDKVVKHNSKLAGAGDDTELAFRDQGFTRPKVLFILPTRGACAKIIDTIVELCQPEQQENRKRFEDNFLSADGEVSADRPDDFKDLFDGNDDDMFRIGIKFTRKTVKFFTQFYNSDIILASPLGLRSAIDGGE